MPTVMLTFFRETYALAIFVHISNILAVTGPILTEAEILHRYFEDQPDSGNCHYDICPGNIFPGDICPYKQYLSRYWPNFDQTFNEGSWEHIQQITTVTTTFVQATFVHISNNSVVTGPIWIKL